ncbi:MAG: hypothetical protein GXP32_04865 [Kiritimatiellaeota bacterium]|nr:hypothetical protein [Kiritimatiellota bacterium]
MSKFRNALRNDSDVLDQIQLNLNQRGRRFPNWTYDLHPDFLLEALDSTRELRLNLELFPWVMSEPEIF